MNDKMTWEEAVLWLKKNKSQSLIEQCYFHDNPIDAGEAYIVSEEFNHILDLINTSLEGMTILDVGAGNGIASYAFAKKGAVVDALEPDPSKIVGYNAINFIKNKTRLPISVHNAFGENLPFENGRFDLVFARQVVHHSINMDQFFLECYRVLKKNGVMLTIRDHVVNNADEKQIFFEHHLLHHKYGGENAFSIEEYEDAIQGANFTILKKINTLDSVINYYPETNQNIKIKIRSELKKQGKYLFYLMSKYMNPEKVILKFSEIASNTYHSPGRLVSYKLLKP